MAKKYTPNEKEKYMSEKQKTYFKNRFDDRKNEIIELNSYITKGKELSNG